MDYLTISQLRRLIDLGGLRNAQITVQRMEREGYVKTFRADREKVLYLSKKGREEAGGGVERKKTLAVHHFLMRNDVYIRVRPERWKNEPTYNLNGDVIRPDALFAKGEKRYFLEVDRTQSMSENRAKVKAYGELRRAMRERFPRIMFVTTTEFRRAELRKALRGFDAEVLTQDDIL